MRKLMTKMAVVACLFSGAAVPVVASPAHAEEKCTADKDDRSPDNWTSAVTKLCINTSAWKHGSITFQCWKGQTIGWNEWACELNGRFTIRKGDKEILSKQLSLYSKGINSVTYAQDLTFQCDGPGEYTLSMTDAYATLSGAPSFQSVELSSRSVSAEGC